MRRRENKTVFEPSWSNRIYLDSDNQCLMAIAHSGGKNLDIGACDLGTKPAIQRNWVDQIWLTLLNLTPGIDVSRIVATRDYDAHLSFPWEEKNGDW